MSHVPHATRRRAASVLLGGLLALACAGVGAQDYPARPIRVIVTSSAGSTGDTTVRILAPLLERSLGQPIVVENAPGAGGVQGTDKLVRSAPDGYTLGLISNNHAINPHIIKNLPFDSERDIAPIAVVGSTPVVLVAHPSLPAHDTQTLIALARRSPGSLNYGSAGNGTVLHLAGVLFTSEAQVDIRHVPYKGLSQMTADLMGGQIQLGFAGIATVASQVKAGKLKAIAVSTPTRSGVLPDVPTFAESGLPGYSFEGWLALVGPAALPPDVVRRLNRAVDDALRQPQAQASLAAQGVNPKGGTPEQAGRFIHDEMAKHAQLVKRSGATLD